MDFTESQESKFWARCAHTFWIGARAFTNSTLARKAKEVAPRAASQICTSFLRVFMCFWHLDQIQVPLMLRKSTLEYHIHLNKSSSSHYTILYNLNLRPIFREKSLKFLTSFGEEKKKMEEVDISIHLHLQYSISLLLFLFSLLSLNQGSKCGFRCRFEPSDLRKIDMSTENRTEKLWKKASDMPFSMENRT